VELLVVELEVDPQPPPLPALVDEVVPLPPFDWPRLTVTVTPVPPVVPAYPVVPSLQPFPP
jgi:hypothetical protein